MPTFVDIAGGPKGDELNKQIQAGKYPGIVKTMLDGVDQRDYLEGTSPNSARDTFFYYSNSTPSAVRYKNWKMYYTMTSTDPTGAMQGEDDLWLDYGRQYQARPLRDRRRVGRHKISAGGRRRAWPLHVQHICMTGTCCPSASSCGKKNYVVRGIPSAAGAGNL